MLITNWWLPSPSPHQKKKKKLTNIWHLTLPLSKQTAWSPLGHLAEVSQWMEVPTQTEPCVFCLQCVVESHFHSQDHVTFPCHKTPESGFFSCPIFGVPQTLLTIYLGLTGKPGSYLATLLSELCGSPETGSWQGRQWVSAELRRTAVEGASHSLWVTKATATGHSQSESPCYFISTPRPEGEEQAGEPLLP